ncbi:unnamed protein product [Clonostachys rosea]|uniref:Protein-lysine N-methyltransferase EFM4 n=1 Tax=Bionectria ochroleuca TaxID=29856 RepID=A0ABY6TX70_BIOOC|nr:unnamed protein product [Clonostachys rosea]
MSERPTHLEPSKLGTKEYWNNLYTNELANNSSNPSDIGTVWFDDSDAEAKILEFLSTRSDLSRSDTTFLDLGCGNGSLLFSLREVDDEDDEDEDDGDEAQEKSAGPWTGRMLGVDYSPQSVALANQIASSRDKDEVAGMSFQEWDILGGSYSNILTASEAEGWDVILDKGTFDAISLSDNQDAQGRRICEGYRERVLPLVKQGGLFIITSCNWTEKELRAWFESSGGFALDGRVEYRTFSFGGVKGQTITTLCFRKL